MPSVRHTHSRTPWRQSLAQNSLIVLLITSQLFFGGVHAWTYTKTALALGLLGSILLAAEASRLLFTGRGRPYAVHLPPLSFHALLFTALALIQILPLRAETVQLLSPARLDYYPQPLHLPEMLTLSLSPALSRIELLKWIPLGLAYFLTVYSTRTLGQVKRILWIFLGLGLFQAAYGIYQTESGSEQIWNWVKTMYRGWVTGTYISRNELAFFLEMTILLGFGMAIGQSGSRRIWTGLRSLLAENFWKPLLPAFISVLLAVALLLTGSRGGILSCGLGLLCMAILLVFRAQTRGAGIKLLVATLVILTYGVGAGLEKTAERFGHDSDILHRLEIARSVLPMIDDFAQTGTGLGSFNTAYMPYALETYGKNVDAVHAHNDWAEIAAETGWPGLFICLSGFVLFFGRSLLLWSRRKNAYVLAVSAACLGALISLAVHSFFDFGMRIPANVLAAGMLCGLLWTTLHLRLHGRTSSVDLPLWQCRAWGKALPCLVLGGLLAGTISFASWARIHDLAEGYCPTERSVYPLPQARVADILQAIALEPDNPAYPQAMGQNIMTRFLSAQSMPNPSLPLAEQYFRRALELDPANGLTWRMYAQTVSIGTEFFLGGQEWPRLAAQAHERAMQLRPHDPQSIIAAAQHAFWCEQQGWEGSRQEALRLLGASMEKNPLQWREVLDLLVDFSGTDNEIRSVLPQQSTLRTRALSYAEKKLGRKIQLNE